jgi:hypothetical protein
MTELVRVLGRLVEEVELGADAGAQAHDDLLADRVDRRVGDLREQLLEVAEERRLAVREAPGSALSLPIEPIGSAPARHRRDEDPQVLLRVAEGHLDGTRLGWTPGQRDVGLGQVGEVDGVLLVPLAVGLLGGDLALDLVVLDDPALLEVDQEELARLQATEALDARGLDAEQAGLRAQDDEAVLGLAPAAGRRPLRSSVAPMTLPSVKQTAAGPSHGSIRHEWKA